MDETQTAYQDDGEMDVKLKRLRWVKKTYVKVMKENYLNIFSAVEKNGLRPTDMVWILSLTFLETKIIYTDLMYWWQLYYHVHEIIWIQLTEEDALMYFDWDIAIKTKILSYFLIL